MFPTLDLERNEKVTYQAYVECLRIKDGDERNGSVRRLEVKSLFKVLGANQRRQ